MIEYIEVRGSDTNIIGIVDIATTIIWRSEYFGVGDFEIHTPATPEIISLLKAGRFVTRPDNDDVGIIEKLYLPENADEGATITASGRFVKSILDRRLIYNLTGNSNKATILRGNVENAVREVIKNNAIACPFDSNRNISLLALGEAANIPLQIVDDNGNAAEKQVTYENLLTYTDGVLEEYGIASKCILQDGVFLYTIYSGIDRSINNSNGNMPVIFSKEFDNLTSSEYTYDETTEKNVALIGGEGEGVDRFYSLLAKSESDLQRREIWIDAKSIKKTLKASEIQEMFPAGAFTGVDFTVDGVVYATLVIADTDKEYTLKALQEKFPKGTKSGTKFNVDGVTYANRIYGDDEKYSLTPLGYKAMLDADEKEGNYLLTDAVYISLLNTKGKQDIAPLVITETFDGTIDATNGNYVFGRDFSLGDIVTVQNNNIGIYMNVRIREALECQDENGYTVEVKYQ
jgi:hypothetical protein